MIQFYEEFPDFEKVATLSRQLTWSHFKELDIRVSQYLTAMPPKEELEEKLHLAIERAKIQLEQRKE